VSLVLDSSITLAWLHEDEGGQGLEVLFDRVIEEGAHVPTLWRLEVANALTVSVRRERISAAHRIAFLDQLARLNIASDAHTDAHAWNATLALADLHGLTVYDAAYLELAQRLRLPLASLDMALVRAALAAGVTVLPTP